MEKNIYKIGKELFITSDEEIKDNEWHLHYYEGKPIISKSHNGASKDINLKAKEFVYKKIILTTDQDLIADGVQAIDNEFLEWFVKNPSCKSVEIRYTVDFNSKAVIIIPKEEPKYIEDKFEFESRIINEVWDRDEEPKQNKWDKLNKELDDALEEEFGSEEPKQETLEEEAETMYCDNCNNDVCCCIIKKEERMYNEEEVKHIISEALQSALVKVDLQQWFKQFKKK